MRAADVTLLTVVYRLNRGRAGGRPCVVLHTGAWRARGSLATPVFVRVGRAGGSRRDQLLSVASGWLVLAERPGANPVSPERLTETAARIYVPAPPGDLDSRGLDLPSGVRLEVAYARDVLGVWPDQSEPG